MSDAGVQNRKQMMVHIVTTVPPKRLLSCHRLSASFLARVDKQRTEPLTAMDAGSTHRKMYGATSRTRLSTGAAAPDMRDVSASPTPIYKHKYISGRGGNPRAATLSLERRSTEPSEERSGLD
jgi:hypothetical protein